MKKITLKSPSGTEWRTNNLREAECLKAQGWVQVQANVVTKPEAKKS